MAALLLLSTPARAQDPTEKLQALLRELTATDAGVWAARLQQLEREAIAQAEAAAKLRAQAAALQGQAAAKEAAAQALRQQVEQLRQLQALVAALPKPTAAAAAKAPPAAMPEKTPEAKPMPPSREAKPTAEKKPAAATKPADKPTEKAAPAKEQPAGEDAPAKAMAKKTPAAAMAQNTTSSGAAPDDVVTWSHVAPLFDQHCAACHDPDTTKGGLDLTSFAAARQGGGSGRTLVAGEPMQSRLYLMIAQQERPFMPKDADPLPADAVAKVRRWIEQGAAEDAAGARAFAAEKAKAAADKAAGDKAKGDGDSTAAEAPLPVGLPSVPLQLPPRPGPIQSLARSRAAPLVAMPGVQQLLLFDAELQPLGVLPCPLPHIAVVGFTPDGSQLFAAGGEPGRSGRMLLFDVRSGRQLAEVGGERDVPLAAAAHAGRQLLALGGSGKRARVVAADGREVFAGKHDDFVLSLAFNAAGTLLAAADRSGTVQVYELPSGRIGQTLAGHRGAVDALAFRDDRQLATAGADGTVRLWDAATGKEQWRQDAHRGEALGVAFGPGDRLASCGSDGRIRLFTLAGKPLQQSPAAGDWLYAVAFGGSPDLVFAGDWQGRVHRFDAAQKRLSAVVPLAPAQ